MTRIKAICITFYQWIFTFKSSRKCTILNAEKTCSEIISKKISLIRYGDGEFFLMNGCSIHYQKYSEQLSNDLKELINLYCSNYDGGKIMLAMPKRYFECTNLSLLKSKIEFISWVRPRYEFKKNYDRSSIVYGDAFLFAEKNSSIYEKIWRSVSSVLFVHNDIFYAQKFQDTYNISTDFYKVPSANSYETIHVIVKEILSKHKKNKYELVLISAGPCAKIIIQVLARREIWAIDTGHCWDEPLD